MITLAPYDGSLLRLALKTAAIAAVFAAALSAWQGALGDKLRQMSQSRPAAAAHAVP